MLLRACMYVIMCVSMDMVSPAPELFERFYSYSLFKSSSVKGQCPVNMNIPAQKTGTIQMDQKEQNDHLQENDYNDSDYISILFGDHLLK
jgi:hypothetical protein